jgi:hypothetical protein
MYQDQEERAELGRWSDSIEKSLRERNEGRNLDCWPVCSFGWKDADLDPSGCTGIKSIRCADVAGFEEEIIFVEVGGHKTLCYYSGEEEISDEKEQQYHDIQFEVITDMTTGYQVDGDEEEVTVSFTETIRVPWSLDDEGEYDGTATIDAILEAARKACERFEADMVAAHKALNELIDTQFPKEKIDA